jgi:hypothetical protein
MRFGWIRESETERKGEREGEERRGDERVERGREINR